jgi:antitoxin VapB
VTWCDPLTLNPRSRSDQWYHLLGRKVPMALNIKDDSVHEAVKRITLITGESQAQAVATAVRERLARLEKDELAARLLAIGHKSASRMSADAKALDHGALLYDDRGLPS